jgi:hypothetical protein
MRRRAARVVMSNMDPAAPTAPASARDGSRPACGRSLHGQCSPPAVRRGALCRVRAVYGPPTAVSRWHELGSGSPRVVCERLRVRQRCARTRSRPARTLVVAADVHSWRFVFFFTLGRLFVRDEQDAPRRIPREQAQRVAPGHPPRASSGCPSRPCRTTARRPRRSAPRRVEPTHGGRRPAHGGRRAPCVQAGTVRRARSAARTAASSVLGFGSTACRGASTCDRSPHVPARGSEGRHPPPRRRFSDDGGGPPPRVVMAARSTDGPPGWQQLHRVGARHRRDGAHAETGLPAGRLVSSGPPS